MRDGQKKLYTGRDRRRKRKGEREVVAERERVIGSGSESQK